MGKITTLFVKKVLAEIDTDIDKSAFVQSLGIELDSQTHMISDADYYAFFEKAATIDRNGVTLPLRAGAAMRSDNYGVFGLAWKSATTLRGSYNRAERYAQVLTTVSTYEVQSTDEGTYMHLHRSGERTHGMRLSNEATIASILTISREVSTGTIHPIAVYFKHQAPVSIAEHESFFGCPVHFDSDRDALLLSNETLQTPNKLGDASISKFFESQLETELSKLDDATALDRQIRHFVTQSLSEGIPMLSEVARHFGMSGRSLQRRLSESGYSYQTLVDESRRQLAERLLRETNFSLVEVAFMTGFSEQSAFARAFKRWAGQTPRNFRLQYQI